jgi:transcription elongation GreA/GreB family factor
MTAASEVEQLRYKLKEREARIRELERRLAELELKLRNGPLVPPAEE